MKLVLVLVLVFFGCGDDGPTTAPADATVRLDGRSSSCTLYPNKVDSVSCLDGKATTQRELFSGPGCPSKTDYKEDNVCAQGCALGVSRRFLVMQNHSQEVFAHAPRVMCAESLAHVGDSCDATGATPCLPTRAVLDPDGTVASQQYLKCESGHCVENTSPPTVSLPLAACDASVVTSHGGANVNGFAEVNASVDGKACLLAWNDATQTTSSGLTHTCAGDWDCEVGLLCDDLLQPLGYSQHGVCKPGPRGTLTPSMLSP